MESRRVANTKIDLRFTEGYILVVTVYVGLRMNILVTIKNRKIMINIGGRITGSVIGNAEIR
jgi:hypothetical protein